MKLPYVPSLLRRLGLGLAALVLSACASNSGLPPAPSQLSAPVASSATAYEIGPLDVLNVAVWRNPEVSGNLTVRPDGFITLPLAGDLKAAGKRPPELAESIKAALSKMVLDPSVSVTVVTALNTGSEQVRIIGEIPHPQSVLYRKDMTLLDLVLTAGGLTNVADGNNAILIRGSEGDKKYSLRVKDLVKGGDMSANVPVMPGDIVTIPQSTF